MDRIKWAREAASFVCDAEMRAHLQGVSSACALIAHRRGLDAELCAVMGLLHDVYAAKTGIDTFHAMNGAEMARVMLKRVGKFTAEEVRIITSAIHHHSDKQHRHDAYDEVLKDADVLDRFLQIDYIMPPIHAVRLLNLAKELNLQIKIDMLTLGDNPVRPAKSGAQRTHIADIAGTLVEDAVVGARDSQRYMEIIRYWPEDTAFDELKNGWCAAFVYHCVNLAGFHLPIVLPSGPCRLAGVAAWNAWARKEGLFFRDAPARGDIVLYRNSIPPENKPEDQRHIPIDHIGIVLEGGETFRVAEGNVLNQNASGVIMRTLDDKIEGFIRIPDGYIYDGWKFDYKTGKERCEPYGEDL